MFTRRSLKECINIQLNDSLYSTVHMVYCTINTFYGAEFSLMKKFTFNFHQWALLILYCNLLVIIIIVQVLLTSLAIFTTTPSLLGFSGYNHFIYS